MNRHRTFTGTFITVLLAAALICIAAAGCARPDSTGTSAAEAGESAKAESGTAANSSDTLPAPVEADNSTEKDVTKSIGSLVCPDASDIYDLSSLYATDRASLMCYGMYDAQRVLLIYLSKSEQLYRAVLLDLVKKSLTPAAVWKNSASGKDDYNYVKLLSCNPLVVFDSVGNIIYRPDISLGKEVSCSKKDDVFSGAAEDVPDGNPYTLSEDEVNVSVQCLNGSVYLSDPAGFLKKLTVKDTSPENVYALPYTYSYFTPVNMGDTDRLTFLTYPQTDSSQAVFAAVEPGSGNCRFYTCDTQTFYDTEKDGYLFSTYYDSQPAFTVCDPSGGRQARIVLPDSISDKLEIKPDAQGNYPSDGGDVPLLNIGSLPVCGDMCLFSLDDSYGSGVSDLYLTDLSEADWQSYTAPEKKDFTLSVTDYGDLTQKARELEEKYGLKIEMGENVPTSFDDYDAVQLTDTAQISSALSQISEVLTVYPEDYFTDIADNYYRDIVIYLTGTLTPHDNTTNITNAGGFTTQSGGLAKVAFNIDYDLDRGTVIHELTHVLDYRLEGKDEIDDDRWNELNPEGFNYYYSYIDSDGNSYEYTGDTTWTASGETDPERIWFVDTYSKTYPMEDRARLVEYLLQDPDSAPDYFGGTPIQKKLAWYFQVIRDAVGGDDWPEETSWEKALKKAAE